MKGRAEKREGRVVANRPQESRALVQFQPLFANSRFQDFAHRFGTVIKPLQSPKKSDGLETMSVLQEAADGAQIFRAELILQLSREWDHPQASPAEEDRTLDDRSDGKQREYQE